MGLLYSLFDCWGNFTCFAYCLLFFFKFIFFPNNYFRSTIRVPNPDQDSHFIRPDLSKNCFQRL